MSDGTPQGAAQPYLSDAKLYLSDAKRLRSAMESNRKDSEFAEHGGRIVYIVDANIVLLFMRPTENVHHLGPFQRWLEQSVLVTNATLMAEFVFSGKLPGQAGSIYMSTPHFEEVLYNSQKLEKEFVSTIAATDAFQRRSLDVAKLTDLIKLLRSESELPERKVEAIVRQLPPEFNRAVEKEGAWGAAVQFTRLFGEPELVRRIDSAQWFHGGFEPEFPLIDEWRRRLFPFRREERPTSRTERAATPRDGGKMAVSGVKLFSDAATLAMMELLNREQGENTRYLLITADASIRQAVEAFCQPSTGQRIDDFTRHVREFTPLLNLSAVAEPHAAAKEKQEREKIFVEIGAALDELLLDEDKALQGVLRKVDTLKRYWSDLSTISASLALPLMKPRYGAYFGTLAEALEEGAVLRDVLGGLESKINELRLLHAQMTFEGSLISARKAAQVHAKATPIKLRPRAPVMLVDVDFSLFIENEKYDVYFGKVARGEIPDYPAVTYPSDKIGLAHIFYAMLFIVVQLLPEAHTHSGRAVEVYKRDDRLSPMLHEALYCRALTSRFTMATKRDYLKGLDLLGEALDRLGASREMNGRARRARALSERAALRLFALQRTHFAHHLTTRGSEILAGSAISPILDDGEMVSHFKEAIKDLRAVEDDWIEGDEPYLTSPDLIAFSHLLKIQVYSNIAGAWILRDDLSGRIVLPEVGPDRAEDLRQLTQIIKEDESKHRLASLTARLNEAMLTFAAATEEAREGARQKAIATLQQAEQAMEVAEKGGGSINLVDRLEIKLQLGQLREAASVT